MFLAIVDNSYGEVADDLQEHPTLGEVMRKSAIDLKRTLVRLTKKSFRRDKKERGRTRRQLKKMMFDWNEDINLADRLVKFKDHDGGFTMDELRDAMSLDIYEVTELQRIMDKYIDRKQERIRRANKGKEVDEVSVYDLLRNISNIEQRLDSFIVENYGE